MTGGELDKLHLKKDPNNYAYLTKVRREGREREGGKREEGGGEEMESLGQMGVVLHWLVNIEQKVDS